MGSAEYRTSKRLYVYKLYRVKFVQDENLKLLGNFLRAKRQLIQPEMIGLSKPLRSRSKGLRREDVAYKAGISTIWYAQIERGQALGISSQVLSAIAEVLLLCASEQQYIYQLAHLLSNETATIPDHITVTTAKTQRLLHQLNPLPALLQNESLDIINANTAFDQMVGFPLSQMAPDKRNYLKLTIENSAWQRFLMIDSDAKLEEQIYRMAGFLRKTLARHSHNEKLKNKIDEFIASSAFFSAAWDSNIVQQPEEALYRYHHASLGALNLEKQIWWNVDGQSNYRMNIYYPQDSRDEQRLADLLA